MVPKAASMWYAPLRRTLAELRPIRADYATAPIAEGFNWGQCFAGSDDWPLYLVVFRSVRRPTADVRVLTRYDDRAHEEAGHAAGFLHYFKGQLTESRACLSFCLWTHRDHAQDAARRPEHRAAIGITLAMYETYALERYLVSRRDGPLAFERLPSEAHVLGAPPDERPHQISTPQHASPRVPARQPTASERGEDRGENAILRSSHNGGGRTESG